MPARENSDPEQTENRALFADDNEEPPERRFDSVTVEVDPGAAPARKEGGAVPPIAPPSPPPPQDASEELRRQLMLQQQATQRAQAQARAEYDARVNAEVRVGAANVGMIDQAIEAATVQSEQARQAFQAALDRGDHRMASDAQIAISDSRANLLRLQEQKAMVEQGLQVQQRPQPVQVQTPPPQPQYDARAAMDNITRELQRTGYPRSADWLSRHPERVQSRREINKIDGVHNYLTNALGYQPETDAYFAALEDELAKIDARETGRAPAPSNGGTRIAPNVSTMRVAPAAPVVSSAPSLRDGRVERTAVTLTPEQRAFAHEVLGMTDEEYAREYLHGVRDGKIGGVRH